ncbi:MAG TPA: ROK family protein [Acidimicrobiales bacterium]|nr:ROK family protein [Acidimicrobiales bacterium]
MPTAKSAPRPASTRRPATLAVDVGGTGIKASVLDAAGTLLTDPVRVPTTYPLPPEKLLATVSGLAAKLPAFDRISMGFPGMVRGGLVLSAPHFVTASGPGTTVVPELEKAWARMDLAARLSADLGKPAKVVNDADMQGAAVIAGDGLELVVTLGTGVGTGLFHDGRLAPHLELAHHPFRKGETYNEQLGEAARRRLPKRRWLRRVRRAVDCLDALLFFDHLYLGGGNGRRVSIDLGPRVTVVDNVAGILGGVKVWEDWREE